MKQPIRVLAASLLLGAMVFPAPAQQPVSAKQARKAADAYLEGAKALDANYLSRAEKAFVKAVKLDPAKKEYSAALLVAREHRLTALVQQSAQAGLSGNSVQAVKLLQEARTIDPNNPIVSQHFSDLSSVPRVEAVPALLHDEPQYAGAIVIRHKPGTINVHTRGNVGSIYQEVGRQFGVTVVLDTLPQDVGKVDLDNVTYEQCFNILGQMFHSFVTPIDDHTLIAAADIADMHAKHEHQFQETVYLAGMTNEQMNEVGNIVRQVFDIRQATVQVGSGNLVVRAPLETINAMNIVLKDIIDGGSEVVFDLKVYAIDRSRTRNLGVVLPTQISAYNLATQARSLLQSNQSLIDQLYASGIFTSATTPIQIALYLIAAGVGSSSLISNSFLVFGGGITTTVLSAGLTPVINLRFNSSDSRALDDVKVRVHDRETATFRTGVRYPIQTSLFSDLASTTLPSSLLSQYLGTNAATALNNVIPQIQYQDIGLTFKAVPTIQKSGDVHIKMDLKIDALSGTALNGIPVLASRAYASDVSLHDGETILLASNMSEQESAAVNGIPGLSELPGFGGTTNKQSNKQTSELVILLTPHIVRQRPGGTVGPQVPFNVQAASN